MTDTSSIPRYSTMADDERTEAVSAETVFEILSDRRRRYVLECLYEFEKPLALADVAEEVATREADTPITELSAESVKRIYMTLYHSHVPRLVDEGVVAYHQDSDTVEALAPIEQFAAHLSRADS